MSFKTKLFVPIFSLISILIFLGSMVIVFNYNEIKSLKQLNEKVIFSNIISDTLHSLQKERGLSSGYINDNKKYKKDLIIQRKETDRMIKELFKYLHNISCKRFAKSTNKTLFRLKILHHLRHQIDNNLISYRGLIDEYSNMNESLLNVIVDIAKSSHLPIITQDVLAYVNLLYLKENIGKERAQAIDILSKDSLDIKSLIKFTNLLALQKQNESMFLKYALKDTKTYYYRTIKSNDFTEVKEIEQNIISKSFLSLNIDSKKWFYLITNKINSYNKISKYLKDDITNKILVKLKSAEKLFYFVSVLSFLSMVVFIYMIIVLLRLLKDEHRLRLVMDKYIISSVTDLKGVITDVSQAFCNISGYKKDELIGKNHNIIRHPDMKKEVFAELWRKIKNGESWYGKVKNRRKDGSFYWVFANIEPLYDSAGNINAYISIRLDISENEALLNKIKEEEEKAKAQEEIMRQQHRLAQMGEMINMIAHQWRQPLSAITAATASINLKAKLNKLENDTAVELSDKIKDFSMHLSSTIDDFRNFFQTNKTKTLTNYKQIIDSVLSIIDSSLEKNSIELEIVVDEIEELNTYENELKQVILNIIKNAEDALLESFVEKRKIMININKTTLVICDNAGGIENNILDKIFEPYFSTKLKKDGTGLGLYMSKLIVEDHCSGSLSVKNSDDGACFTIKLGESNND